MRAFTFLLLSVACGMTLLGAGRSAQAQCYPGLACPTPDVPPITIPPVDRAPPQAAKAPAEYHFVGPMTPPDPWLALRTVPSDKGGARIMQMPSGTLFRVLERRDKWWYVELRDGTTGWAHSNWIRCCKTANE